MKLKMVGIITTFTLFALCNLVCDSPKIQEPEIIKTNIEEVQHVQHAQEINIVFISNEETKVTPDEYNLLLRVCMSECGGKYGEPLEGKIAVVETILNRSEIYGKSIEEVISIWL